MTADSLPPTLSESQADTPPDATPREDSTRRDLESQAYERGYEAARKALTTEAIGLDERTRSKHVTVGLFFAVVMVMASLFLGGALYLNERLGDLLQTTAEAKAVLAERKDLLAKAEEVTVNSDAVSSRLLAQIEALEKQLEQAHQERADLRRRLDEMDQAELLNLVREMAASVKNSSAK